MTRNEMATIVWIAQHEYEPIRYGGTVLCDKVPAHLSSIMIPPGSDSLWASDAATVSVKLLEPVTTGTHNANVRMSELGREITMHNNVVLQHFISRRHAPNTNVTLRCVGG